MAELTITTPGRTRLRRLRRTRALRNLVAETRVAPEQLIMPHFVVPEDRANVPVALDAGHRHHGRRDVARPNRGRSGARHPLRALVRSSGPGGKTQDGAAAAAANGAVQLAVERAKRTFGDELVVITDVCLCSYTEHGHCGVLENGRILNDATLAPLVAAALSHARAGADVVAPSDMMDGRVAAIRDALDQSGFEDLACFRTP